MRILLCSAVFPPAREFGGIVTWAAQAVHELAARGHSVTVLATDVGAKGAEASETLQNGVRIERHPGAMLGGTLRSGALERAAEVGINGADLAIVSGFWQWPVASMCQSARAADVPVVLVPHGGLAPWVWKRRPLLKRAFFQLRGAAAIRSASAVHFVSEHEAKTAQGLSGAARPIVSHPGVDFDWWSPDESERVLARARAGVGKDKAMFVWVGRFHEVKGLDLLPAAFAPLAGRDWKLVLAGHDWDAETALSLERAFADAGLAANVVFVDGADRESVRTLMRAADGFLLPSRYEAFGFAAAEAAACGGALAVSNHCGIAEVAEGPGFDVLPREPFAWTNWASKMIDSVAAGRSPGSGVHERLAPILSTRASWDRTEALYLEVAQRS